MLSSNVNWLSDHFSLSIGESCHLFRERGGGATQLAYVIQSMLQMQFILHPSNNKLQLAHIVESFYLHE